jgi:hypothetical protein
VLKWIQERRAETLFSKKEKKMTKIEALAKYLGEEDLEEVEKLIDDGDYLVLTDDEADEKAKENILESVWAFNADFLESHTNMDADLIKIIQEAKCDGANDSLRRMIDDEDAFVQDAISSGGRGHFMNSYDGDENEEGEFFIYRMN